jgi:hypothetical protein
MNCQPVPSLTRGPCGGVVYDSALTSGGVCHLSSLCHAKGSDNKGPLEQDKETENQHLIKGGTPVGPQYKYSILMKNGLSLCHSPSGGPPGQACSGQAVGSELQRSCRNQNACLQRTRYAEIGPNTRVRENGLRPALA